jgi:hypothetical protein
LTGTGLPQKRNCEQKSKAARNYEPAQTKNCAEKESAPMNESELLGERVVFVHGHLRRLRRRRYAILSEQGNPLEEMIAWDSDEPNNDEDSKMVAD